MRSAAVAVVGALSAAVEGFAGNETGPSARRELSLSHETTRGGSFCLGGKLVPLTFILGCQRCGTNSLYEDMMNHIRGARRGHAVGPEPDYYAREQHFYATDSWDRGPQHYLAHFAACPPNSADFQFSVDATPAYIRKPIVTERLPKVLPSGVMPRLRFVIMLRDPADRLYAYWDSFVHSGAGVNNFGAWVKAAMVKVKACQQRHGDQLWPPPDNCDEDTVEGIAAGLYAYQLIYWFYRFEPRQFLITSLEAYEHDTERVLKGIASFVGAPTNLQGGTVRGADSPTSVKVMGGMPSDARKTLGHFYYPHNAQLLHTLAGHQANMHFAPSLKSLGIQGWAGAR